MGNLPGIIAIFFALLLAALLVALIFRPDFRDAVLGGPGEASVLGVLTVKGVGIVLLSALLIGGILFALTHPLAPSQPTIAVSNPTISSSINVRMSVNFDPNEIDPGNPKVRVLAYIKTPKGNQPIPVVPELEEGGFFTTLTIPDMVTPFFIKFETPTGTWQTTDFSVTEAHAIAHKLPQE
jgi:hypothetical protein